MRPWVAALAVPFTLAACDRPPEPGPSTPGSRSVAHAPTTANQPPPAFSPPSSAAPPAPPTHRCIIPQLDTPPPAVPAGPDPRCPVDPEGKPPKVPEGTVSFPSSKDGAKVTVEVMREERHRERGLMYRKTLPAGRGMLFVFDDVDRRGFWMHDTCLALDMLFLGEDGTIVHILENVPTMNDAPRRSGCPAKYVLEVPAGYSRKHGIKAGDRAVVEEPAR